MHSIECFRRIVPERIFDNTEYTLINGFYAELKTSENLRNNLNRKQYCRVFFKRLWSTNVFENNLVKKIHKPTEIR